MDALILAAGLGRRLGLDQPKCLIEIGGRPLIQRQIEALRWAGVDRVVVVAGYRAALVRETLPQDAVVVENERYAETNSLYSFALARDDVGDELLVLNADVLFHPVIARALVRRPGSALAYDSRSGGDDEEMKVAVRNGNLVAMKKTLHPRCTHGENVGMIRLSGEATEAAFDAADRFVAGGCERSWLAAAIGEVALDHRVQCLDVTGLPWTEIDFPEDLQHARDRVLPAIGTLPQPARRVAYAA